MLQFLFEVGLEEMPARMVAAAQAELAQRVRNLLSRERVYCPDVEPDLAIDSYSTPRRLAVGIGALIDRQQTTEEFVTGPSWAVAFKNEEPTAAAHAFARKAGVELAALSKVATPKGEYVAAKVRREGRSTVEILTSEMPKELGAIYWPKNMYWRAGKPERFVRPLRWMLALLDDQVVPIEFAGIVAGDKTYGHRILHGDQSIDIAHSLGYRSQIEAAYVLPEVETRRKKIRKALDAAVRSAPGLRWREDHGLVDAVTHLTEWPSVILGSFEEEYLALPDEVLVTVMRDHQKYFAVEDRSGKLAPYFLAVLNTEADKQGQAVIRHGNERVLRSRFKDARFFWDFDQKIPLVDRVEMLKSVTFQKDLGSYSAKTEANAIIAGMLADLEALRGVTLDKVALLKAVELSKTDLTAELVKEFTELQGIVGGLYCRAQGLGEVVSQAIYWQYSPASSEDAIPPTVEGQILGLADRINSIVDMFAIGLKPTGSKDPFALRRAASGVVKILAESRLPITLEGLCMIAAQASAQAAAHETSADVKAFLRERLDFYLRESRGFSYDVVTATLAAGDDDVPDVIARAEALTAVRSTEDFSAISAAFKRMANILRQSSEKVLAGGEHRDYTVDEARFSEPAEKALFAEKEMLAPVVEALRRRRQYGEALEKIATLRPSVDQFFDSVMVMAPEAEIRSNRVALIASVLSEFSKIADFSEIVTG